jgi:hypothetical protein
MSYGWIIDIDHIPDTDEPEGTNANAKGVVGPRDTPDWMERVLREGASPGDSTLHAADIYSFEVRDSDGELYYTGRMITDEGQTEDACYGPLSDFGGPNAGAIDITYPGHPEMDCG